MLLIRTNTDNASAQVIPKRQQTRKLSSKNTKALSFKPATYDSGAHIKPVAAGNNECVFSQAKEWLMVSAKLTQRTTIHVGANPNHGDGVAYEISPI